MDAEPLVIAAAPRDEMIRHYRGLIDRLTFERAQNAGLWSGRQHRLATFSQLSARLALTEIWEETL